MDRPWSIPSGDLSWFRHCYSGLRICEDHWRRMWCSIPTRSIGSRCPAGCGLLFVTVVVSWPKKNPSTTANQISQCSRRSELVFRLCLYIVMGPFAGAFGGLLASAILTLDNFGSTKRWEMIFAIEGKSQHTDVKQHMSHFL